MDIQSFISAVSAVVSVSVAIAAFYFARKKETREDTEQVSEMRADLRATRDDVAEMKVDLRMMRDEWKHDHDDLVLVKAKVDALGQRIDELRFLFSSE